MTYDELQNMVYFTMTTREQRGPTERKRFCTKVIFLAKSKEFINDEEHDRLLAYTDELLKKEKELCSRSPNNTSTPSSISSKTTPTPE